MKGKIIRTKTGYSVKNIMVLIWRLFDIKPPAEISLSTKWDWCNHDCCICGLRDNTYTPQAEVTFEGRRYPICDQCIKTHCPELYDELLAQRAKFDATLSEPREPYGG